MNEKMLRTTTSHLLLRLTKEEKKVLKLRAVQNNTTMTSLIRYLITNNKTISDLK